MYLNIHITVTRELRLCITDESIQIRSHFGALNRSFRLVKLLIAAGVRKAAPETIHARVQNANQVGVIAALFELATTNVVVISSNSQPTS